MTCELEPCNGNADEGEIYDNLREADDARENHIRLHLEGHFGYSNSRNGTERRAREWKRSKS